MIYSGDSVIHLREGISNVSGHINANHITSYSKKLSYFSLGRKRLTDEEIQQLKEESNDQASEGMIHSLRTKLRKLIIKTARKDFELINK